MQHITPEIKQMCAKCACASHTDAGSVESSIYPTLREVYEQKENYVRTSTLCQCQHFSNHNLRQEKTCYKTEEVTEKEQIQQCLRERHKNHESSYKDSSFAEKVCISCSGIDVEIDFKTCDNIYVNDIGTLQLNYCFRITGQEDYQFCIKNLKTNQETSYKKIIGEGSLLLEFPGIPGKHKNHSQNECGGETVENYGHDNRIFLNDNHENVVGQPDVINEEILTSGCSSKEDLISECSETESRKESSCETIEITLKSDATSVTTVSRSSKDFSGENTEIIPVESESIATEIFDSSTCKKICSNCSKTIEEDTIYLCLFGHDSCKECKGRPCTICHTMMGEAKSYCKNHHKGCPVLQTQDHLAKHETDCEFNNFRCPSPRCVFLNTLSDLKLHFLNSHAKSLVQGNSILEVLYGRKDRKWFLYCYESLFVCSYYYYGSHVEFILQYIGANDNAKLFVFEVEIKTMKEKKLFKRVRCAGWNDLSLCKGVCYDYEDLTNCDNSRFQFTANMKIVNMNTDGLYTSL